MTDKMVDNHEETLVRHEQRLTQAEGRLSVALDELLRAKANIRGLAEEVELLQAQRVKDEKPIFSWYTNTDVEGEAEALAGLQEFVDTILVHLPGGVLPDCWRRHPYVVDMLLVLTEGYQVGWSPGALVGWRMDFYTRHCPDILGRVREELANCSVRAPLHNGARVSAVQVGKDAFRDFAVPWRLEHGNPPIPEPEDEVKDESRARMGQADVDEWNK